MKPAWLSATQIVLLLCNQQQQSLLSIKVLASFCKTVLWAWLLLNNKLFKAH